MLHAEMQATITDVDHRIQTVTLHVVVIAQAMMIVKVDSQQEETCRAVGNAEVPQIAREIVRQMGETTRLRNGLVLRKEGAHLDQQTLSRLAVLANSVGSHEEEIEEEIEHLAVVVAEVHHVDSSNERCTIKPLVL
jgi:hypothetical protein